MQHKLKSLIHHASRRKSLSSEHVEETAPYYHETPYVKEQYASIDDQPQSAKRDSHQTGRSRPLSLIHDEPKISDSRNQEDVADRNINKYSSASHPEGQHSIHQDGYTNSIHPQKELTNYATSTTHNEHEPPSWQRDITASRMQPETDIGGQTAPAKSHELPVRLHTSSTETSHNTNRDPVTNGAEDWKLQQRSLLQGVVDLTDTVDTDKVTHWAPAVTHEVVKPHEHEIIQHKIYREIHNYSYYHRLQPVLLTEVLPPRHFIPNPNGEGLIEISADEVPARTGKNRWWDIVQREISPPSVPNNTHRWRTKPESIESAPYITEEGFERRETTTVYPPTLENLSTYTGVVQPVHFDHKTGQKWLGDITTMSKLREEIQHMSIQDNSKDLPPTPIIKRKPINGSTGEASVPQLGVTA